MESKLKFAVFLMKFLLAATTLHAAEPTTSSNNGSTTVSLPTINILRVSSVQELDMGVQAALQIFRELPKYNDRFQINMVTQLTNRTASEEIGATLRTVVRALARSDTIYGAMIGPDYSVEASPICQITPIYNLVNVAARITLDMFSSTKEYPLFFRTSVQSRDLIQAMTRVLAALDISALSTVTERDPSLQEITRSFEDAFVGNLNGTLERSAIVTPTEDYRIEANRLALRTSNYIFASMVPTLPVMMCEVWKINPADSPTWLSVVNTDIRHSWRPTRAVQQKLTFTLEQVRIAMNGSLFVIPASIAEASDDDDDNDENDDGGSNHDVDYRTRTFAHDNVSLQHIRSAVEKWRDTLGFGPSYKLVQFVYTAYDATWALLTALYRTDARLAAAGKARVFTMDDAQSPEYAEFSNVLVEEMMKTSFVGSTGVVRFNRNHDRISNIEIRQYQAERNSSSNITARDRFVVVGIFNVSGGGQLQLQPELLQFHPPFGNKVPHSYKREQQLLREAGQLSRTAIILIAVAGSVFAIAAVMGILRYYWVRAQRAHQQDISWVIPANLLKINHASRTSGGISKKSIHSNLSGGGGGGSSISSLSRLDVVSERSAITERSAFATYNNNTSIYLHILPPTAVVRHKLVKGMRAEALNAAFPTANTMRRLVNDNVVRFVGMCLDGEFLYHVGNAHTTVAAASAGGVDTAIARQAAIFENQSKGSLRELLHNDTINVEWDWRYSFMSDVVKGVQALHESNIVHGFLHTDNVVLDSKFTAKITDYGLADVARDEFDVQAVKAKFVDEMSEKQLLKVLFRSPEQIRLGFFASNSSGGGGNQSGNEINAKSSEVFSMGLVLIEIAMRDVPKFVTALNDETVLQPAAVIKARATQTDQLNGGIIPHLLTVPTTTTTNTTTNITTGGSSGTTKIIVAASTTTGSAGQKQPEEGLKPALRSLLRACTLHNPNERPTVPQVFKQLSKVPGFVVGSVVENLVKRLQSYAHDLELVVAERTKALEDEMQRSEELLLQILPPSVASELKSGRPVPPETYASASIYFSDIVGFTQLSARSSPMQVVDLLNAVYTTFDGALTARRVYKVETIGDAYMVASGLPERIGDEHALEICLFALQIVRAITAFRVPHEPAHALQLRIGIHCGACVAGVIGSKMPRYCLFGDTINTASRMESTGEPMKIHASSVLHELVERCFPDHFVWAERGEVEIKGLGKRLTYWLENHNAERVFL